MDFFNVAIRIKNIADYYNIPLIINDRVDIALAVDAAGVHVGQSDLPAEIVRKIIGPNKILGVSTTNLAEALEAEKNSADYIGVGAMYATNTKSNAKLVSIEELKTIKASVTLPIVVIGGINKATVPQFINTGIDGIAVVSAIISEKNITSAAKELKELFLQTSRCDNA